MKKISFVLSGAIVAFIVSVGINATTVPYNMYVEQGTHSCEVSWDDDDNSAWNLRYRQYEFKEDINYIWDFEDMSFGDWTRIDADGDGNNWNFNTSSNYVHGGNVSLVSESYSNLTSLNPDNWLIGPKVPLDGTLSFWARSKSSLARDKFAVYVCVGDYTSTADFVKISEDKTPNGWTEYTFDLSEYAGEEGYFAIRHYNSNNKKALYIDDVTLNIPGAELHEWINVNGLFKTHYTITDLEIGTDYEVQVQAIGDDGTLSDWCRPDVFTTLDEEPIIEEVHIMGEVDDQVWASDAGTKMEYHPATETYTATVHVEADRTFGFSTKIDANGDLGDWNYVNLYRFGPAIDGEGPFDLTDECLGQELPLAWEWDYFTDFHVLVAGDYEITVSLERNYVIIGKIEPEHTIGDVNKDGMVNVADISALIEALLTDSVDVETEHYSPAAADVNEDNSINVADISALISKLLVN